LAVSPRGDSLQLVIEIVLGIGNHVKGCCDDMPYRPSRDVGSITSG